MSLLEYLREDPECARLAEGAIHAVSPLLSDPDPEPTVRLLEGWAWELAGRMPLPWNLHEAVDVLNAFLFREFGLRGDRVTYEDTANALLPGVIERRRGLPITLSIVWIDLARKLGFDACGVALPGHFLAALRTRVGLLHFDPFHEGRPIGEEVAARLVHAATGGRLEFHPSMLAPVPHRAILSRLVRILHARYLRQEAWEEARWTSSHLVILAPDDPRAYQERALVHLKRMSIHEALEDLRTALKLQREHSPELQARIQRLEQGELPK